MVINISKKIFKTYVCLLGGTLSNIIFTVVIIFLRTLWNINLLNGVFSNLWCKIIPTFIHFFFVKIELSTSSRSERFERSQL